MGGVAGHAGLFSTAADLSIFCRMLLDGGTYNGVRILSPLTVAKMTAPATSPGEPNVRGLGWDLDSAFSSNRGELLPLGSYGHTGFTGTSIWIDPVTREFVVFLANRVHPDGKGDVTPLRAKVATIAASAITDAPSEAARARGFTGRDFGAAGAAPARTQGRAGADRAGRVRAEGFARFQGKRIGLVTNHTGRARDGASSIDLLCRCEGRQARDALQPRARDPRTARRQRPRTGGRKDETADPCRCTATRAVRRGRCSRAWMRSSSICRTSASRFYTYTTTTAYVLEEAAKRQAAGVRARSAGSRGRLADRRSGARQGPRRRVHGLLSADADSSRHDARASWRRSSTARTRLAPTSPSWR